MATNTIRDKARAQSEKLELLMVGYKAGCTAGEHDTTPGNIFRGAWGAARELGFYDNETTRKGFTIGYVGMLGNGVTTDENGKTINAGA